MSKKNTERTANQLDGYNEKFPDWYWKDGLHDACIVGVDTYEFPFDRNINTGEKNSYDRNLLTLHIDASGALCDGTVKEIRFYNYKILSDDVDLQKRKKAWWLYDSLSHANGHWVLEIHMEDCDSSPKHFTFKIKFDRAEVDRT